MGIKGSNGWSNPEETISNRKKKNAKGGQRRELGKHKPPELKPEGVGETTSPKRIAKRSGGTG